MRENAGETSETIRTLAEVDKVAAFAGFTEADFEIFDIGGFTERMAGIREHIKPKLIQLGQLLSERLSQAMDEPLYPHVAQHLRRTVNPPVHTWVAFARSPRAYKPFVHLRVAINREHLVLLTFVEDYAEEKATFAASWRPSGRGTRRILSRWWTRVCRRDGQT